MPANNHSKPSRLARSLVIGGVVLLALVILALKDRSQLQSTPIAGSTSALPEAQLERALSAGSPTLAFFHSNTCQQCLKMIGIVEQVLPEFSGRVTLVDVNIYDKANEAFADRARIQYIPTLVFYDRSGQSQVHVGVMEAEMLRQRLSVLASEQ